MSSCDGSSINKNYIVLPPTDIDILSACTGFYTNNIYNCTGDTLTLHSPTVSANTINTSVYLSGGTNLLDIFGSLDNYTTGATLVGTEVVFDRTNLLSAYTLNLSTLVDNNTFVTGYTYDDANTFTISDNSGSTFNVTFNTVTGLTVNGGLSATTISACTGIYTSNLYGCSPITVNDSLILLSGLTFSSITEDNTLTQILGRNSINGDIEYRDVSSIIGAASANTFVTGFTYDDVNTFTISDNSGTTFNASINVLSATTISATTYFGDGSNLSGISTDNFYVTGGTYNEPTKNINFSGNSVGTTFDVDLTSLISSVSGDTFVVSGNANAVTSLLTFSNNTGGTFTVANSAALFSDNDINVTGGTYDPNNGCVTFGTNSGTTFDICGFVTGLTDTFVTGGTYNDSTDIITFTNTSGNTFNVTGITDSFITGGTYSSGTTSLDFSGNTGFVPFSVNVSELIDDTNTFVTGYTYDDANTFTISDNDGSTFSTTINNVTGLTVNGGLSATTITACTGIYTSNLYGCSPITVHDNIQSVGSSATGTTSFAFGSNTTASGYGSHAEGSNTTASGYGSHAEGDSTTASGDYGSHAEGYNTTAIGNYSHAEGVSTNASGLVSHAEGYNTTSNGFASHAEGDSTSSSGGFSHTEGSGTTASGFVSHAEGSGTVSSGTTSHAEGSGSIAGGGFSHAEGYSTTASGLGSHAEGISTTASGNYGSHSEGISTTASGEYSHAEGSGTVASGDYGSHAEGYNTTASGEYSHAEGSGTVASGEYGSHAEGYNTTASGSFSHTEGSNTTSIGDNSHAEGSNTTASGDNSHAEGSNTTASGDNSHSEGISTTASGQYSHAEGSNTTASGDNSHAEGSNTTASDYGSHAEGYSTTASGDYGSHAEGYSTTASGDYGSHAEGSNTTASGYGSHAEGSATIASGNYSHSGGRGFKDSKVIASGETSFAHFKITNNLGSIGSYGEYSVIIGGNDHNIGTGSTSSGIFAGSGNTISDDVLRSVVIGGGNITGTTSDTVYVPNLNVKNIDNDDSLTQILSRDSSDGTIKYRDVSSIIGAASANTFVTGFTYNDSNTFTISDNNGSDYSTSIDIMTGLTVNGQSTFSGTGTDVVQIYGSGSTTPIFRVEGSAGELFSITDGLIGELFAVNDISGIPILQVHSDNRIILGDYASPSLYTTTKVTATAGSLTSIYSVPLSAYTGAWFEYTVKGTTSLRAGNIASIFSGASINHNETTTTDIGDTSDLLLDVIISGTNATLTASATTSNWEIKTIIRSI